MKTSRQVTVVGGSSFIGLHLVSQLLDLGVNVNITTRTVRALTDDPVVFLKQKYPHSLNIFAANILDNNFLAKAFKGSEAIFHLVSPVLLQVNGALKEQIQPTVDGTKNVLEVCLGSDNVKTIVITSSTCAIHSRFPKPGYVCNENDYHVVDAATDFSYIQAKLQTERDIWDFQKEHSARFRIVVINPPFVFGPEVLGQSQFTCLNSPRTNLGKSLLANYLTGNWKHIPQGGLTSVDVRDVARAHIQAYEDHNAQGCFIVTAGYNPWRSIISYLKNITKHAHLPDSMEEEDMRMWHQVTVGNSKSIQVCNMQYLPLEVTLTDFISQLPEFL